MSDETKEKGKSIIKNYKLIGLFEGTFLILLALKIMGYITVSWFWVFLPLILHVLLIIVVLVVIVVLIIGALIGAAIALK